MKQLFFQFFIVCILLITFSACDKSRVFEEYHPIPGKVWHKDSLVVFKVPVTDTVHNYNLLLNVRNDIEYSYSNLWLFIETNQPGHVAVTDTFELSLAAPSGKWLGEGFGGIKNRQVVFKRNVYFPVSGEYQVTIQHGMRDADLEGISDIGFRVEKL